MSPPEAQLDRLLELVERQIDLDHCEAVDKRYRAALSWQEVDRPPLVVQAPFGGALGLPGPWDGFRRYTYRETFESPVAMLQNMLLDRVVSGLLLKDDNPLAIRNNHGTIQVASALGGDWKLHADNYPWVAPLGRGEAIREIASGGTPEVATEILSRSIETLEFYRAKLSAFENCRQAVQISLPDLQGPMDTADQLWGSEIFLAFFDEPELLDALLARVVDTMVRLAAEFRGRARDRLDPAANTQHGYVIPGRLLIRNDSSIMLSPQMYAEFVRPHDARLLREVGKGAIHFCGDAEHLVDKMLEIPDLLGLDFGESHLMDVGAIYARCRERRAAVTNLRPPREDLLNGKARAEFPTGCVLVYATEDMADAEEVLRAYRARAA